MPNWFSLNEEFFPAYVKDLNFHISMVSRTGFTINHYNDGKDGMSKSLLGFNFLVIGPNMPDTNIKHGIIYECTSELEVNDSTTHGINFGDKECSSTDPSNLIVGTHTGVKVFFDSPFTDIPSVIVTPLLQYSLDEDEEYVSRCIVDAIAKSYAIVKCGSFVVL
eukprot:CAMPEP_0194300600 /NCGR_PEP_ID=MMETSP0169-20130528/61347_1 /TAXON_ID=218684 /ORGANISM="Corethron pennatum, Strain L29A3" /LENGTH=163 /DNA_ID=CAMNT_0039050783 /DNA_START=632 /DNA_END=1120 /DNA_ORIENTATION=+